MKHIYALLLIAGGSLTAVAQAPKSNYIADSMLSRWVIDVNLLGGLSTQNFTTANSTVNYLNAVNASPGELKYKNGLAYGADAQLGFFFGKKRHFGFGTGIMYLKQQGDVTLDKYHIEYQATDFQGSIFRQLITGNNLTENLKIANVNIPVMLKYKNRFSKRWGFTADAGALINVQMKSASTTHASFDYEAIYQFTADGNTTVYDNSPIPSVANDWMITKAEFVRNNPNGNMADYFNAKRALGFNVGLNEPVGSTKGNVSYAKGSIGFMVQPSFNYFLSDHVALNFGGYYLFQPFKNTNSNNYHLTDGNGSYSSMLNNVTASTNQSYGINIGVRIFLGSKGASLSISSIDQNSPTQCGMCDGNIILHGLTPNQTASVDYNMNGVQQKSYQSTVQPDGQLKIANLCAGNYSGIVAKIHNKKATGTLVSLTDPVVYISSQNAINPSLEGVCDASIRFNGLSAGKSATINYSLNGTAQAAYTGVVNTDNSITISGLCEGKYSGIVATVNSCSTKGSDVNLLAPVSPPPPPTVVTHNVTLTKTDEDENISGPVLFEFDKAVVNESYYPQIEKVTQDLKENKGSSLTIDGHADTTGLESHNEGLSLRRANSVKYQLTKRGISPNRVKTRGHGSRIPIAPNTTVEGRQKNRRAVITINPANKY